MTWSPPSLRPTIVHPEISSDRASLRDSSAHASSDHAGNWAVHVRTRSPTTLRTSSALRPASAVALACASSSRFSVSRPNTMTRKTKIDNTILVRRDIAHLPVLGPQSEVPGRDRLRTLDLELGTIKKKAPLFPGVPS